ncbi:MAG TPA: hypothetical protein VNT42_03175 [Sphingomonas sp.]|nr:hypothetical protein [Sphingomonas sp.]
MAVMMTRANTANLSRWIGIFGTAMVVIAGIYIALAGEPKLPIGIANGTYANRCCGTISLRNGVMTLSGGQGVRYVVGKDKGGAYVFPEAFVGVWQGRGFQVEADRRYPLKLRLNDADNPTEIVLTDVHSSYAFVK